MRKKSLSWMVNVLAIGAIALTTTFVGLLITTGVTPFPRKVSDANAHAVFTEHESGAAASSVISTDSGLQPPDVVKRLCESRGGQEFVAPGGQRHTFYESAASVQRCEGGAIWKAEEDGAKVNDAATFYFDKDGKLKDICQVMFWRSGCTEFERISCDATNYCEMG